MNNKPDKEILVTGREYPGKDEDKIAAGILKLLQDEMDRLYPGKTQKQLRQIHPKMNGCVKAEFNVEPGLPDELRVGLFKEPNSFPAWIRLSNGKTKPLPDWKKDIRGFAIKIMNVPGEKPGETVNHDFILMNTRNFVSGDVKQFGNILKVVTTPKRISTFFPKLFIALSSIPVLLRAKKAAVKLNNPLEIPYYSTVPFRFGDEARAVKYAITPSPQNQLEYADNKNENFLRASLVATLNKHEIFYDFFVQFQTDPVKMPMENPTVTWTSPFIKLATIRIPKQVFDTPEQDEFCENLAFNSWHCLPEHTPLGNFNRVRQIVYKGMYKFRQEHNDIKDYTPHAGPDFFNSTNKDSNG